MSRIYILNQAAQMRRAHLSPQGSRCPILSNQRVWGQQSQPVNLRGSNQKSIKGVGMQCRQRAGHEGALHFQRQHFKPMLVHGHAHPLFRDKWEVKLAFGYFLGDFEPGNSRNKDSFREPGNRLSCSERQFLLVSGQPEKSTSIQKLQRRGFQRNSLGHSSSEAGSVGSYRIVAAKPGCIFKRSGPDTRRLIARNSATGFPFRQINTVSPWSSTAASRADNRVFAS